MSEMTRGSDMIIIIPLMWNVKPCKFACLLVCLYPQSFTMINKKEIDFIMDHCNGFFSSSH